MKIAMMTNNYKPFIGGVPISIERLSQALRAQGHEVVVFAPSYKNQTEEENVVRYRSLIKGVAKGASVPDRFDAKIEQEFAKGDFDVIHVHHPMLIGRAAMHLSKKYNVPIVFTYHTRYEQYLHYIKASFLAKAVPYYIKEFTDGCDMVFAPTPLMQSYLQEIGSKAQSEVLPTGLEEDSFIIEEEKAKELREKLLGDKKYLFCSIARLAKEKNIDFIFRVLAKRKAEGKADFKFALIGEGPKRKELEKLAEELDLREEVIFVGKVPNSQVKNYCKASDLFLFASLSETQGIVLLEAMAAGTPVLAVRATGVCDIVQNGRNGFMTSQSENEFYNCLDRMLTQPRGCLERGALETAMEYRMEKIASLAAIHYRQAIVNRKQNVEYDKRGKYAIL